LCTWQIDGRPILVYERGTINELPNKDKGEPGTQYLVRLRVAGKYRIVDWERLEETATPPQSSYFVIASWTDWAFQEMSQVEPGLWSCEARLDFASGEFAIVRNKDMTQTFYPADFDYAGASVYGPDDWGRGLSWTINGSANDVFRIQFRRVLGPGQDEREVSWQHLRDEEVPTEPSERSQRSEQRLVSPLGLDVDALIG